MPRHYRVVVPKQLWVNNALKLQFAQTTQIAQFILCYVLSQYEEYTLARRLPDLQNLNGNPLDEDNQLSNEFGGNWDRPPKTVIDERRREMEFMINSIPAGALSGGHVQMDPSDNRTWIYSDDPELADFARNVLGYDEDSLTSLSNSEKLVLHQAAEQELSQITAQSLRKEAQEAKRIEKVANDLWPEYVLFSPEMAADPDGARAAMERLIATSPLTKSQLADLAEKHRNASWK